MLIVGFPAQLTGTNCYLVAPAAGEQCLVVDPGIGVGPQLDELIAQHRLHPVAVVLTHGHLDHTFSVVPVCDARDVPAYIHPADRGQLADPMAGMRLRPGSPLLGLTGIPTVEPADVRPLVDGAPLTLAGLELTVRHAPGHTLGSVIVQFGAELLTGDVLFAGSIGRVDLPGGSMTEMNRTLRDVILPLDDGLTVLPGHGPATTIGRERLTNPYLQGL